MCTYSYTRPACRTFCTRTNISPTHYDISAHTGWIPTHPRSLAFPQQQPRCESAANRTASASTSKNAAAEATPTPLRLAPQLLSAEYGASERRPGTLAFACVVFRHVRTPKWGQ